MTNDYTSGTPSQEAVARAMAAVTVDLRPVRELPSDRVLMGVVMLMFAAVSLLAGLSFGLAGFKQLSITQRWIYYGTVLACSAVLSGALVPQMIPGSKRRVGIATAWGIPLAAMAVCAIIVFPRADLSHFVSLGWPCLRAGLFCAAGSSILAFLLLRRGYFTTPLQACVLSAVLAGFTGVAMLSLHCPQQNWFHVLVWHLGVPVLSGLAAFLFWQIKFILDVA